MIYAVTDGEYSGYSIRACYTNREAAYAYAEYIERLTAALLARDIGC